jgi:50S ribosomal protein L16 3-hydroxylase
MALDIPKSLFGKLTNEQFLAEYWQKKPLLVRNAWPNFITPLLPTGLKELACREDAESRLVIEKGGSYPWEVQYGPFEREDFIDLPDTHWTLLVQHVDALVPEIGRMLGAVDFLPNWRLDDIMISYAPGAGGVGAHIDNYDVFLLQAHGRRRWQIQSEPTQDENLIPDIDVRILSDFRADQDWVLEPGDMLYLPPRIAHFGVAEGHCMTFSIGCRAPSRQELVASFLEDYLSEAGEESFYSDAEYRITAPPGRLGHDIKSFARTAIESTLSDTDAFERWLGRYLTRAAENVDSDEEQDDVGTVNDFLRLHSGARLRPRTRVEVAYDRLSSGDLVLFAAGEQYDVPSDLEGFLSKLTHSEGITAEDLPDPDSGMFDDVKSLIQTLFASGILITEA